LWGLAEFGSLGDVIFFVFSWGVNAMDGAALTMQIFRTPARILIPKLVVSRNGWKTKAGERKWRLKAAQIRSRDLEASRGRWPARAGEAERQMAEVKCQFEQLRRELSAARSEAEQLRDALKKKSRRLR